MVGSGLDREYRMCTWGGTPFEASLHGFIECFIGDLDSDVL